MAIWTEAHPSPPLHGQKTSKKVKQTRQLQYPTQNQLLLLHPFIHPFSPERFRLKNPFHVGLSRVYARHHRNVKRGGGGGGIAVERGENPFDLSIPFPTHLCSPFTLFAGRNSAEFYSRFPPKLYINNTTFLY